MIKKLFTLCVILITCSSCSEFALLASGASIAGTQNAYVKAYNGVDMMTIMSTDKDIKRHVYDKVRRNNKMANLEDALRSKDYWRDPDYKFLIEENAELQKRIIELEQEILEVKGDNKKLAQQISIMMERMRDADF